MMQTILNANCVRDPACNTCIVYIVYILYGAYLHHTATQHGARNQSRHCTSNDAAFDM